MTSCSTGVKLVDDPQRDMSINKNEGSCALCLAPWHVPDSAVGLSCLCNMVTNRRNRRRAPTLSHLCERWFGHPQSQAVMVEPMPAEHPEAQKHKTKPGRQNKSDRWATFSALLQETQVGIRIPPQEGASYCRRQGKHKYQHRAGQDRIKTTGVYQFMHIVR